MLEIKFVRHNLDILQNALDARGQAADLDTFKTYDDERRSILQEIEALRHRRNVVSDQIAEMKKAGEDSKAAVAQMREVSSKIKELDKTLAATQEAIDRILLGLPNIPHPSVPFGKDESENPLIKKVGEPPKFTLDPKPHWDVGTELGILDFERAAKITGARFPLYFGAGAGLERALINFMLDMHTHSHGYTETLPPFMVNRQAMIHTGQL
ncbi:MAG: serine--tRNA ligase, partial [Desulfobacterales bacterium]|nr:serine--tRNA ligase [Desulfobacterales bacterium]